MTDYSDTISMMQRRRDYFQGMEFFQIASDYTTLLAVIESLQSELKIAQDKLAEKGGDGVEQSGQV